MPDEKDSIIVSLISEVEKLKRELAETKAENESLSKTRDNIRNDVVSLTDLIAKASQNQKVELTDELQNIINRATEHIIKAYQKAL